MIVPPNIIKTKIVSSEWDSLWNDIPAALHQPAGGILILTTVYAPASSEETQLKKMLSACGLTDEQYNIIQVDEEQNISWHKLRDAASPKVVILLGISPRQLGISAMFQLYKPNNFNGCTWIAGISLTELEKNPDAKRQLWQEGLKPVLVDNG